MLVADILRTKAGSVVTVRSDDDVGVALARLTEHDIGAVVVTDDGATVVGILSERDIVRSLDRIGADALGQRVGEQMTADVVTCTTEQNTGELMELMTENRVRHVPVVRNRRLVGLVSIGDVVKDRVRELEEERRHLEGYISPGH